MRSNNFSKITSSNCTHIYFVFLSISKKKIITRRTGELRPVTGPNVQRPRSKTNKLYYYQGYHDGSIKYKRKPPKGMYINHDDVLKLAAQDLNETMTPRKQPVPPKFDLLTETEREISVLHSQVRLLLSASQIYLDH